MVAISDCLICGLKNFSGELDMEAAHSVESENLSLYSELWDPRPVSCVGGKQVTHVIEYGIHKKTWWL